MSLFSEPSQRPAPTLGQMQLTHPLNAGAEKHMGTLVITELQRYVNFAPMNNLKVKVGYIPERLTNTTPQSAKERAKQFNKWAKRLLVSETVDK